MLGIGIGRASKHMIPDPTCSDLKNLLEQAEVLERRAAPELVHVLGNRLVENRVGGNPFGDGRSGRWGKSRRGEGKRDREVVGELLPSCKMSKNFGCRVPVRELDGGEVNEGFVEAAEGLEMEPVLPVVASDPSVVVLKDLREFLKLVLAPFSEVVLNRPELGRLDVKSTLARRYLIKVPENN